MGKPKKKEPVYELSGIEVNPIPSQSDATSRGGFIPNASIPVMPLSPVLFHQKYMKSKAFKDNLEAQQNRDEGYKRTPVLKELAKKAIMSRVDNLPKMQKVEPTVEGKYVTRGSYNPETNTVSYSDDENLSHELGHYYDKDGQISNKGQIPVMPKQNSEYSKYVTSPEEVRSRVMAARNDVYRMFQAMPKEYKGKQVMGQNVLRHYYDNIWKDPLKSQVTYEQFEQLMNEIAANDTGNYFYPDGGAKNALLSQLNSLNQA